MLELITDAPASVPPKSEDADMGKVVVELELVNAEDEADCRRGFIKPDRVRRAKVRALVDTGATGLCLSEETIKTLGLSVIKEVTSRFANGQSAQRKVYGTVIINIMGRSAISWTVPCPKNVPALMGQVPLELLDLMVDPRNQRLVPGHSDSPDMAVWESY